MSSKIDHEQIKYVLETQARTRARLEERVRTLGSRHNPNPDLFLTLSTADAHQLPEREFRRRFCIIADEIRLDFDPRGCLGEDMPFIREGRDPRSLSTNEMRELVLKHQDWFNPRELSNQ